HRTERRAFLESCGREARHCRPVAAQDGQCARHAGRHGCGKGRRRDRDPPDRRANAGTRHRHRGRPARRRKYHHRLCDRADAHGQAAGGRERPGAASPPARRRAGDQEERHGAGLYTLGHGQGPTGIHDMRKLAAMWAVGALIAFGGSASAAEIKALITTALKTSIDELAPLFERATGHKLRAAYGPSSTLVKRIVDGEDADFVIVGGDGTDALTRQGKVVDGSSARFARSMIGAAVAKGAPKPDISSAEAFKRALLAAKSVAYSDAAGGGASGVFLAKAFEKLGIAAALKAKAKLAAGGPDG